jgi:hypothetical protein
MPAALWSSGHGSSPGFCGASLGAQAFVAAPTFTIRLPRRSIAIVCDGGCRAGRPTTIESIRFFGISESVR